jgi:hypothetical protein
LRASDVGAEVVPLLAQTIQAQKEAIQAQSQAIQAQTQVLESLTSSVGTSAEDGSASGPALVGSKLPSVEIDCGFPPEKVNLAERTKGKRVILVGLPGAFTPT